MIEEEDFVLHIRTFKVSTFVSHHSPQLEKFSGASHI